MRTKSFAKINLGLEIVRRREDGFHDIRTLFQSISLCDELTFEPRPDGEFRLEGNDASVPWDDRNLIAKAAGLLRKKTATCFGATVRVRKSVPPGKGLGGGSSNAALALAALNTLWGLNLTRMDLAGLALAAGSDVPYFLHGGLCLGESRGEALRGLPDFSPIPCVLVFPPYAISTAEVYAGLGPFLTSPAKASKIMRFLDTGNFGFLENDLEKVIFRTHPELDGFKGFLKGQGATLALVSGSGSSVFGLFPDIEKARAAMANFRGRATVLLAETLPRTAYWEQAGAGV
jgi:4-diphosphocytidyl-2-C-methyl-D-erythritol kinase